MPFEESWYAAGPDVIWGKPSTYALIPGRALPPLPQGLCDGSFRWLPISSPSPPLRYEYQSHEEGVRALDFRHAEASAIGLRIPEEARRFLSARELYSRVHSITGCFLEISSSLIDDPSGADGKLVRFLCDSQGCVTWYLYITEDTCSVLGSGEWRDGADDETAQIDPSDYFLCAPTFEQFILRFWLENEVWHRVKRGLQLSEVQSDYLTVATANRSLIPSEDT